MRLCLFVLLALGACAAPHRPDPPAIAVGASHATILAIRPIVPAGTVLAMIGVPPAPSGAAAAGRREFILRTDAGKILSIVAEADGRWRTGATVSVTGGDQAGLALPES